MCRAVFQTHFDLYTRVAILGGLGLWKHFDSREHLTVQTLSSFIWHRSCGQGSLACKARTCTESPSSQPLYSVADVEEGYHSFISHQVQKHLKAP